MLTPETDVSEAIVGGTITGVRWNGVHPEFDFLTKDGDKVQTHYSEELGTHSFSFNISEGATA